MLLMSVPVNRQEKALRTSTHPTSAAGGGTSSTTTSPWRKKTCFTRISKSRKTPVILPQRPCVPSSRRLRQQLLKLCAHAQCIMALARGTARVLRQPGAERAVCEQALQPGNERRDALLLD